MKITTQLRPWQTLANLPLGHVTWMSDILQSVIGWNMTLYFLIVSTPHRILLIILRKLYLQSFSFATMITTWGTFPPHIPHCLNPTGFFSVRITQVQK
ncbi:hypothetical protein ACHAXR_004591 [Thalassiosira sp. AJA248-18]